VSAPDSASPLRVVGVSGALQLPSRTSVLLSAIVDAVTARVPATCRTVEVADLGGSFAGALTRDQLGAPAQQALHDIETADLLVVASPVYRGSFTGLFKHLFDFVEQYALVGTPVLLAATGGGDRHALILEHQLRPLFGFFQALTLPVGVYASGADFDGYALRSPEVHARIGQAVDRGLPLARKAIAQEVSPYVSTW